MSSPTRAQSSLHPSRSLHSAPLPLYPSWLPQRAQYPLPQATIVIPRGRPTPTVGRPRAVLHLEPQPDAPVHPELQLQGNGHQAQIIIILILLPGHDTLPVERCAPRRLISTRSSIPYNSWGSARLRRRTSCMGIEGRWGISQPTARHDPV